MRRALPLLLSARLLGALALWLPGSIVLWIVIGVLVYEPATDALVRVLGTGIGDRILAALIVMGSIAMAALLTAVTAIAVFTMPAVVRAAAGRYFPSLERRRGGTWHGSMRNVVVALVLFVPLWLASFALLALPPLYIAVSWSLTAWLNQRLFRYDALAEHASAEEIRAVLRENRGRLLGLGLALSPLSLVPVVNLLVLPIYAGIAFTELCLAELARLRAGPRGTGRQLVARTHSATSPGPR